MTDLPNIISRLEACQGADLELDHILATEVDDCVWDDHARGWIVPGSVGGRYADPPAYTSSLDAGLAGVERALVERLKPGAEIRLQIHDCGETSAYVDPDTFSGDRLYFGSAPTPALALCLALCRALEQKEGEG